MKRWLAFLFVFLTAACSTDPAGTEPADAARDGRTCAEQGGSDADCARCGAAPESANGHLTFCPAGECQLCSGSTSPECGNVCALNNGKCISCGSDGSWKTIQFECHCPADAGP